MTIISRSIEISITRGVVEIEDCSNYGDKVSLYILFMPTTLILVTHNSTHVVL